MSQTQVLPLPIGPAATGLARLAFADGVDQAGGHTIGPRHLAFLPPEALDLDLSDPAQRDFGVYELLEKIGQGGMGVVYRARQKALDREVALKLLAAGPWASADFITRFREEAKSAARMEHPNIVTVYETGSYEDLHYFSMQLVRGQSLATLLGQSGPYAPIVAARLMRTVAEALDYAHRLGVLHLDLKPGNILVDEHGEPLVADFGLARRIDEALAEQAEEVSGTPSYMAPEQAQAQTRNIGVATDIYGLGAILYQLLTGAPPFLGATPQETLQRVVDGTVQPPRALRKGIPADLDAICLKCLAKDPAARYTRARELADDLSRFIEGRPVSVRPLNRAQRTLRWARRDPRLAFAIAATVLVLIGGLLATLQQWRRAQGNARTAQGLLWESRRDAALGLQRSGDGYAAMSKLLTNIVDEQKAGAPDAAAVDRRRLGLLEGLGATLIDRTVIADANPMAVAISPDARTLAVAFNDQSVRWYDTATLSERGRVSLAQIFSSDGQRRTVQLLRFIDNHRLRATLEWFTTIASPDDGDTWMIDLDQGALVEPPAAFKDFADATYSADGGYAILHDQQHRAQLWLTQPWRPQSLLVPVSFANYEMPWLLDPQAHAAFYIPHVARYLSQYDLADLATPHDIAIPGNAGIFAWALSHDGKTLALGDFEGRAFLLDVATRTLRQLPKARGREITWVGFSEDDAWLAVGGEDGAVDAFDARTGDSLVAGQMKQDFKVQRVGLSHAQRLLIASGEGKTALWRLPLPGPRAVPALRIAAAAAPHGLSGRYPAAWSFTSGLLATAGMDGQLRLWRMPLPATLPAMAARQMPERTYFDGHRLVDVAWNRVRIVDASGIGVTPWLTLPQPPGFAELLDGGRLLVLTVGPELRAYDTATMRERFAPIALENSPERLLASADGSRVVLAFGGGSSHGFVEKLQLFDARKGVRLPGEAVLPGQLRHLAFSADASRLLVVGATDDANGATIVFATNGLRKIGAYANDPYQPVQWADFATSGDDVLLVLRAGDPRLGSDSLIDWNPVTDKVIAKHPTAQARPLGVAATTAGAFVAGSTQDLLIAPAGTTRTLERSASSDAVATTVLSADGRLLARAFRREVQIYDVETMAAIGPPLQADTNAIDTIEQLAFSPDNRKLLARTVQGHWLVWPIAPESRSTYALADAMAHLSVGNESQQFVVAPLPSERAALRAHDPGRWPAADTRPSSDTTAPNRIGVVVPERSVGTSPLLLDLTPYYDMAPDTVHNTYYNVLPTLLPYPAGVQRIAGTDFDIRGMVDPVTDTIQHPIHCLAVPATPVAAVHLLFEASLITPLPMDTLLGEVTLHYVDGGSAALPIRAGRDAPGYEGQDAAVPFAFATDTTWALTGLGSDVIVAPRLPNPHPDRTIRCLDVTTTVPAEVFAITLEPAASATPAR
ncbi:MAG: protein kinase [Proteobacteria bacterium]|nr:protein kinase [Pseudomonadota bacterium]MBS0465374.1 protein kinase [Pseudomonadota bacterium]